MGKVEGQKIKESGVTKIDKQKTPDKKLSKIKEGNDAGLKRNAEIMKTMGGIGGNMDKTVKEGENKIMKNINKLKEVSVKYNEVKKQMNTKDKAYQMFNESLYNKKEAVKQAAILQQRGDFQDVQNKLDKAAQLRKEGKTDEAIKFENEAQIKQQKITEQIDKEVSEADLTKNSIQQLDSKIKTKEISLEDVDMLKTSAQRNIEIFEAQGDKKKVEEYKKKISEYDTYLQQTQYQSRFSQ